MSYLPDLEGWAIFAKVAELGSFAGAATELGLSQATVSKAVARLEKRLGSRLLHRTSRRLALTDGGRQAAERASRLLAETEALEAEVTEQALQLRGRVRLAAPMSFGIAHLAPLLPTFLQQHPEVVLDVNFSDEQVDLVGQGYDLALRIAALADSSLLARRLCAMKVLLVGAPAYFEQHGHPQHPRDLVKHTTLQYSHERGGDVWHFRHSQHGEFAQALAAPLRVNNAEALLPALRAGLGLSLQPMFLAWSDLQAGTLQTTMSDWQVPAIALHLVTPPGRGRPARVQALMEYLATHFAHAPWAQVSQPT